MENNERVCFDIDLFDDLIKLDLRFIGISHDAHLNRQYLVLFVDEADFKEYEGNGIWDEEFCLFDIKNLEHRKNLHKYAVRGRLTFIGWRKVPELPKEKLKY